MANDRYARYGAASGIVATVLLLVGFGLGLQDVPDLDAAAPDWSAYVADNQGQIQFGATLAAIGIFFLIWFLGTLRTALRVAEGGAARLTAIAYAGGIVGTAALVLTLSAIEGAAFRDDANADVVRGLFDLSVVSGAPAMGGVAALFAATAIIGYRYRPFPAFVAGFAALAAVAQPLALGAGVADSGAWSGEGAIGLWLPFGTFALATIALSVALMRAPGGAARAAPAQ
jgi:hypothetical protein